MFTDLHKTFIATSAIEPNRRVKLSTATTTSPPSVEYAGAGEYGVGISLGRAGAGDMVAVKLWNDNGTFQIEANGAIDEAASLYGTANGRVDDAGTGTVQFIALQAASGAGSVIECTINPYLATAAGSVSVADAGGLITTDTVEAAIAQLASRLQKARIAPMALTLEDGTALTTYTADPTPGWAQLSNKEVVLKWGSHATPTKIAAVFSLPDDLNGAADVEVHVLARMSDVNDTPDLVTEAYFNDGDTDCAGTDDEIDGAATLTEYVNVLALADVPNGPAHLTVIMNPKDGQLGTDDCYIYAIWVEYTRVIT